LRESHGLEIALAIDMESERHAVLAHFEKAVAKPERYLFLPEALRNHLDEVQIDRLITEAYGEIGSVNAAIICTEPKVHKPYALWAMKHGLHVFMDKPLTAPVDSRARGTFYSDFLELFETQNAADVNAVISCERRFQFGYRLVFDSLREFIREYRVPVTGVNIHFAGGTWMMPREYVGDERHPYKYGYGLLLHSGYHFVDLLAQICALNRQLFDVNLDDVRVTAQARGPGTFLRAVDRNTRAKWLKDGICDSEADEGLLSSLAKMGETDVMATGELYSKGHAVTNFALALTDMSASGRRSHATPADRYLGGGRLRQERVTIHLGPLCSIFVSSDAMPPRDSRVAENFSITIYQNNWVTGGERVRWIERFDLSASEELGPREVLNTRARQDQLLSFLTGGDGGSTLASHGDTAKLLDALFNAMAQTGRETVVGG
jgi:hypothetical protein